ncbi:MAG: site-specific integrase [Eubacterium sp.]|jgi:integrase|nr:site-specific integrase [Eubacterium sp.]
MTKNKKRLDGRIQSKVFLGNYNGKKNYKYVYGKTQKEVDNKILEIKIAMKKGIDTAAERDTMGDWAAQWLKQKQIEVSNGRYVSYNSKLQKLKNLFNVPIIKIRTQDLQNEFTAILSENNTANGRYYSKGTLKELKNIAVSIFKLAIDNRVIDYNPAQSIRIPNGMRVSEKRSLTDEERSWIIDFPHRAQRAAMIMMFSGLRRGELIPLLWNDINLKNSSISVNKSVEFINGKPVVKDTAKTKSSIRTVYIPKILVEFLSKEKHEGLLVCPSAKGTLMSECAWKRLWESYLTDLNHKYGDFSNNANAMGKAPKSKFNPQKTELTIPRITAHWLRHTFITLMYLSGVDILTAKEQAGHSDIKTTMEIYTHLDKEYKQKSMLKMDEFLSGNDKKGKKV